MIRACNPLLACNQFNFYTAWVTPSDAPKQVYPLASTALIFSSVLIVSGVFLTASTGQFLSLYSVVGGLFLMLRAIRTLSTRVTEAGVSQLNWRGRVHLSWTEITRVTRTPLSFRLTGDKKRVVVSVEEFQDTAAAIAYIESHLPSDLSNKPISSY